MKASTPIQDIHTGRAALARDLERYLNGRSLIELGWEQPDDLTLLIPMFGVRETGERDLYLLKLVFDCYPAFPPSAQFINPLTRNFAPLEDARWMPSQSGVSDLGFHLNYNNNQGQLICSSMTAEFYKVNHDVKEEHVWTEGRHTFMSTIAAIRPGLVPPHYRGRQGQ
jgi:hypothetical protein